MRFRGSVVKRPFGIGSKSAHDAVMIVTSAGDFVLRREGGNAFSDPQLDALVGHTISGEGTVHGHTLILQSWKADG